MKIHDISQEVFTCVVYPGDPAPGKDVLLRIARGDVCNLTAFHMCAHNGTHIDAPFHFFDEGRTVDTLSLEPFIGAAYVTVHEGVVTAEDAQGILLRAQQADSHAWKRILIKGKAEVSLDAAKVFASSGILLLGNESQTVGPEDGPMAVHKVLLGVGVVLLEGIRLAAVSEGAYFLNAAPLNLSGADGAPCRAVLIETSRLPE